jgi:hypothetical protein
MKKSKLKALAKKAKKSAFKDIKIKLISDLTEVASNLGKDSNKIRKTIKKESEKIAKKLSGELSFKVSRSTKMPSVMPDAVTNETVQPVKNSTITQAKQSERRLRNPASPSSILTQSPEPKKKDIKKAAEAILPQT